VRKRLLNIEVDDFSMPEFLQAFDRGLLVTPNADHLALLQEHADFLQVYREAEFVTVDSQIVKLCMDWLGTPVKAKLSGSDLFPAFCAFHAGNPQVRMFLLGGKDGVATEASRRINQRAGRSLVVGAHSPSMRIADDADEATAVIDMVNASGATVLAVGLGAPKQELWIAKHRARMPQVTRFLAIGATLDFEAGQVSRAPPWISSLGLEWLYRLVQEPGRLWRRYLVRDPKVLWLVLMQRLGRYRCPFEPQRPALER
jgi:N-acetylglucosaminyldiphosphoundecaprenol N-acetyl-beta-D-mannosaminyltransferase